MQATEPAAGWAPSIKQRTACPSAVGTPSCAEADAHPAQVYTNTGGDGAQEPGGNSHEGALVR